MNTFKKVIILAVVISMSLYCFDSASYAGTNYSSITSDSIREKQNKIKESEAYKKTLQNNLSSAKEAKKKLEGLKNDVAAYMETLDNELSVIQEKINILSEEITEKEADIVETTAELEEAVSVEEQQYQAMKDRIKFMYERGDNFYIEMMLNASTFSDFLTKASYIDQLEAYDRKMLDEYTATREWTELCKETLEAEKDSLDAAKAAEQSEQETLESLLAEKEIELANYNTKIKAEQALIDDYQAQYAEEVAVIEALEAQILAEKKAIAASMSRVSYDGGMFTWPCPGYLAITEEFGWRTHPITGRAEFHSGIDIGAYGGTPILAAYDGVVVAATYNWSMGNYVMIDHGDGLYTIYMHASKLYVSSGTVVCAGEQIAAVGTTGCSTGNHLHFGVRLNGTYVSPWSYFN